MENHSGGIAMIAFVVALAVSMTYYQFFYLPEANARPILPKDVVNPAGTTQVSISEGSAVQSNPDNFVPKSVRGTLGLSNKVVWENKDTIPHTVTTDNDYRDAYSGVFDSQTRPEEDGGPFVMPGKTYEFLFTKAGEYNYHCVPHPWMTGKVEIVPNFA